MKIGHLSVSDIIGNVAEHRPTTILDIIHNLCFIVPLTPEIAVCIP